MQIDRRVKDAAPYGVNDKSQFIDLFCLRWIDFCLIL